MNKLIHHILIINVQHPLACEVYNDEVMRYYHDQIIKKII